MNVKLIKTLKRVGYFSPLLLLLLILNSVMDYNDLLNNQGRSIKNEKAILTKEEKALDKLKKDYNDKLAFIEANKINLEQEREKINKILTKIDSNGYFKSSILSMSLSKKYINVAKAQISIETKFKSFDLNEFEDLISAEAKRLGLVYPMRYVNPKSGLIWLIILDKKIQKSEVEQ